MVVNKRKKSSKFRALTTHGYGSMKKNRGAGNRGGHGGTGKRGDSKVPSSWGRRRSGKYGFTSKSRNSQKSINISEIDRKIESLTTKGKAKKDGEIYSLNLKDIGYDKLLGKGSIKQKYNITAEFASKSAVEIVEKNGGKVILPQAKE